jgi:hypothetical protein
MKQNSTQDERIQEILLKLFPRDVIENVALLKRQWNRESFSEALLRNQPRRERVDA